MNLLRVLRTISACLLLACGFEKVPSPSSTTHANTSDTGNEDPDPAETETETETDSDDDDDDDADTHGGSFIPDVPMSCSLAISQCDPLAQDCPDGEKCSPSVYGECSSWISCKPVTGDKTVGEPCTIVDLEDDCDADSWCYPGMLEVDGPSVCVAFCGGSYDNLTCADPDYVCVHGVDLYEGLLGCRPRCDPLAPQLCLAGEHCTLGDASQGDFGCLIASDQRASGEACTQNQQCAGGLCVDAVDLLECAGERCCASFCDTVEPDCPAGSECVAVEPSGNPESTVGVCVLPA
jgi:hypothetical protein